MCGRFTQHLTWTELVELYRIAEPDTAPNLPAHYNVAPTQEVSVIVRRAAGGSRAMARMRWGLVLSWAKDIKIGAKMINARAETVATKPAFREAFVLRRCLIPADGFYEWQAQADGRKQPYYITAAGGGPLTFAGLWESWRDADGVRIRSCTIITTEANGDVSMLHNRMPAILTGDAHGTWLDVEHVQGEAAHALLAPCPPGALTPRAVSSRVNSVRNDDVACIEPLAAPT